jgi:predicted phage terminase large subunit-like protein
MILDDMESDEQVMNKERRDKFRRWFYGALLPALSESGVIRYVGTILHADSMLENLMPKYNGPFTIQEELKQYQTKYSGLWRSVKYKAHNEDFSKILWPDRWTKEELKALREDYVSRGLPEQYSQEYLNIPVDETTAYFRKADFIAENYSDKDKPLNYYIASDMAISESARADWSVFVVGGVDDSNILHIKKVVRSRMDGREIVDTMIALQKVYNPLAFAIEETQISKAIGPYLNVAMLESNTFINVVKMKPHRTDKQLRAQSIRARMRAGGVKFDKAGDWYPPFEEELIMFPRARHDDQVDAFAYLGLLLDKLSEALTPEEQEEEDYKEELENSGDFEQGRNEVTGY